jgi:uncharacterized membrane protein HdeD (DUF308 family)
MNENESGADLAKRIIDMDIEAVNERRGWFMALGVLLIVLGMVAIGAPFASGVAVDFLVGWLLVVSGVAHGVHAFTASGWRGGLVQFVCGLLYLGVGIMMIVNPITGLLALTVTVLVYFVASGIFKIVLAVRMEHLPQRGWVTFSGILSLALAIYIGSQFPGSALWLIGMLVGIEMLFSGWAFVMVAWAARNKSDADKPAQSGASGEIGA